MALPIELDPFKPQHPQFPIAVGHHRSIFGTRFMLLSTEPSDRPVRGDDPVAWDERGERVVRESGSD